MNSRIAAFEFVCRTLNPSVTGEGLVRDLHAGNVPLDRVAELASQQYVTPALYQCLLDKQALSALPADFGSYLHQLFEMNRRRNAAIMLQLVHIARCLNKIGVEPVLLKGAASLATRLYANVGVRVLGDIDLLVPRERLQDCVVAMERIGYRAVDKEIYEGCHHYAPLVRGKSPAMVEIHHDVSRFRYRELLPAEDVLRDTNLLKIGKAKLRLPSLFHRLLHNVINTQLHGSMLASGQVEIRQLYEFLLLARTSTDSAVWDRLAARLRERGSDIALVAYGGLAARFFDLHVPDSVARSPSAERSYRRLRRHIRYPALRIYDNVRVFVIDRAANVLGRPRVLGRRLFFWNWYRRNFLLLLRNIVR